MDHKQLRDAFLDSVGVLVADLAAVAAKACARTMTLLRLYDLHIDDARATDAEAWARGTALPFDGIQRSVVLMTPRELVLMLHHLDQVGALYADAATRESLSLSLRQRLVSLECRPVQSEASFHGLAGE